MLNSIRPLAVVTGSSEGIGYELSKIFASHGFDLLAIAETNAVVETVQICRTFNTHIESLVIDFKNSGSLKEMTHKLASIKNPIEVLVVITNVIVENINIEIFQNEIKQIIKEMVNRQKGRILFIDPNVDLIIDPALLKTINKELQKTLVSFMALSTKDIFNNKKNNSALMAQQIFELMMADENIFFETETFSSKDDKTDPLLFSGGPVKLKH